MEAGYAPYEPSLFEPYEHYSSLSDGVDLGQLVTVMNSEQKFQLLRPDITTVVLRDLLPRIDKDGETKLFYQSAVYRSDKQSVREINQFGLECLGNLGVDAEKEMIGLALKYLEGAPFLLEVGTTKFIGKLIALSGMAAQEEKIFRSLLLAKNKEELMKFARLKGLPEGVQELIPHLFSLRGELASIKERLKPLILGESLIGTLSDWDKLEQFSKKMIFDVSMASEITYYDGTIFKGYYRNVPRAILSGGRYRDVGIGFSIDVDSWLKGRV